MNYHEIPKNGLKTYITTLDLDRLCTSNMWKCNFQTLQAIAHERGWDALRRQYWEQRMLTLLIRNAEESGETVDAEKALKAIRSKPVDPASRDLAKVYQDALADRIDREYDSDLKRLPTDKVA